jgi:multiple sugar transport system permease protein
MNQQGNTRKSLRSYIFPYLLMSPVLLYLLIVMMMPFFWAIWISLTDKMIGSTPRFVALKNYIDLLSDPAFIVAARNTLIFTVAAVVGKVVFGMIMGLILNEKIIFRNLFRVLLFLPWTIPTLVSVLTWKWIFSDVGGVLNYILMKLKIISMPIGWLYEPTMAMVSIVMVNVWRGIPFLGIAILAGLQSVSIEMYEAAKIDGAHAIRRFWSITLPSIKEVVILSTIITTIWTLNDFEIVWLLTGGGPADTTQVLSSYSYMVGFMNMNLGKAVAISIISLPFMIILINYITKKQMTTSD